MCLHKVTGLWKQQYKDNGKSHFADPTLNGFLEIIHFSSDLFGETVTGEPSHETVAASLNFAKGDVDWNKEITVGKSANVEVLTKQSGGKRK